MNLNAYLAVGLGSALGSLANHPMGALGQLGHPSMGHQLQAAAAYPSILPQFHQYPQHQVGFVSRIYNLFAVIMMQMQM